MIVARSGVACEAGAHSSSCASSSRGGARRNSRDLGHSRHLGLPAGHVDREQLRRDRRPRSRPPEGERARSGEQADRRLDGFDGAFAALDDPGQDADVLAEARPQEAPVASLRNQLTWKMRGSLAASPRRRSRASARSSRPCCSRRTAASPSDRGGRPDGPVAAAVVSDAIVAPTKTPCFHEAPGRRAAPSPRGGRRRGSPRSARPPGLPTRADRRALGGGRGEARVRVRGLAPARGRPGLAVQSVSRGGGSPHALPPDVAVGVSAMFVKIVLPQASPSRSDSSSRSCRARRRRSRLGVDRPQSPVLAEAHPGDVVADRLDLPARQGRHEHREVRLAARRRERAGDVVSAPADS